jgi:hypothetical protein
LGRPDPSYTQCPSGIVVSDADIGAIIIERVEFHGEWKYTISPTLFSQTKR